MQRNEDVLLLEGAEGVIEPDNSKVRLDDFISDLSRGKFFSKTIDDIPYRCMDSRPSGGGRVGPMTSGGSLSLFVADDLTSRQFTASDSSVAEGLKLVMQDLKLQGLPFGGHVDDTHDGYMAGGCSTADKLPTIYNLISRKPDLVKKYVEIILGDGAVRPDVEQRILHNVNQRTRFSSGSEIVDAMRSVDGSQVETLQGQTNAVVATVNWRDGETLDKLAIVGEYGDEYQAFNVDAWSLVKIAERLGRNPQEIGALIVALVYVNVATALAIAGPSMKLVIVK